MRISDWSSDVCSSDLKTAEKVLSEAGSAQRALAAFAEEKALRSAIDRQDFEVVARLVVAGTSTQIRRMAAEAIEDPELLRQLIREVRGGTAQGVYTILTSKRDLLLEQARTTDQLQVAIKAPSAAHDSPN